MGITVSEVHKIRSCFITHYYCQNDMQMTIQSFVFQQKLEY